MNISNFSETIRLGGSFPVCFDVSPITDHEGYGVMAHVYTHRKDGENHYFQLRKHNEEKLVAFFAVKFDDIDLPEYWKNSILIWDSRKDA